MLNKKIFAVFLIATIGLLHSAAAIKCYQCRSLTDPDCAKDKIDANSNIRQVDCDTVAKPNTMDQYQAVSKCNKVKTSDKAGVIISRDCHFEIVGQKDSECIVTHSRQVDSCYTCKGDLCNASGAGSFAVFSVAALLALAAIQITF